MLLALQAPMARDLRLVVSSIHAAEKIKRTKRNSPRHVAELTRRRHPACAVPEELATEFVEMARLAVASARRVQDIIAAPMEEHSPSGTVRMTGS